MTPLDNPYKSSMQEDPLQDAMEYRDHFEDDEEFQEALAIWPVCPQCGRRRITTCPICHTSGTLFPLADAEFWVEENNDIKIEAVPTSPGCNCGGTCGCHHDSPEYKQNDSSFLMPGDQPSGLPDLSVTSSYFAPYMTGQPQDQLPSFNMNISVEEQECSKAIPGQKEVKLLACYVCSEPFVPHFPARCEWCGYRFEHTTADNDDISDNIISSDITSSDITSSDQTMKDHDLPVSSDLSDSAQDSAREEISPRILFVLAGLAVLSLGAIIYLLVLFN